MPYNGVLHVRLGGRHGPSLVWFQFLKFFIILGVCSHVTVRTPFCLGQVQVLLLDFVSTYSSKHSGEPMTSSLRQSDPGELYLQVPVPDWATDSQHLVLVHWRGQHCGAASIRSDS